MTTQEKRNKIKSLTEDMINQSCKIMKENIDKALNSGAIDIDKWDEGNAPMILPKIITTAILQNESRQHEGKGTSYEKLVKKEVKNISYFL